MGKITVIIEVVLLALVFQKNPLVGMLVVVFYAYFKYRKSRFFYNKLIVKSGRRNTRNLMGTIEKGFDKVCATMIRYQSTKNNAENDLETSEHLESMPAELNIYKN